MTDRTPLQERLTSAIRKFPKQRILVIGDIVADQFVFGEIARVSREAPVMILRYESMKTIPGGAGNTACNIASLDARAVVVGLVGKDQPGRQVLLSLRQQNVDTTGVIPVSKHVTPVKVRILAGLPHSTKQQVIRIDREETIEWNDNLVNQVLTRIRERIDSVDGVILSDYHYGVTSDRVIEAVRTLARERKLPVTVDSRFRLTAFHGFTTATPNETEVEEICRQRFLDLSSVEEASKQLRDSLSLEALLVTRGSRGMILLQKDAEPLHIPIVGGKDVVDVTGAGDTVIANYTVALASGASYAEAAHIANYAAGAVVMKRGTATVSRPELFSSILRWKPQRPAADE